MKKHKNKFIAAAAVLVVLVLAYWWGGDAPGLRGWEPQNQPAATSVAELEPSPTPTAMPEQTEANAAAAQESVMPQQDVREPGEPATAQNRPEGVNHTPLTAEQKEQAAAQMAGEPSGMTETGSTAYSESQGMEINGATGKDAYQTNPVSEGKPVPIEPQETVITDKQYTCTLAVRCDTVLNNIAWLEPEKIDYVPQDGIILAEQTVSFYEGESVFNLLQREMKKNKIQMEFTSTPIYNSVYIEGIQNLYELDCGELSGWMYRVNGWFPNYGCSRYQLKPGDKVEWVYSCDLGYDVGGEYASGNNG